MGIGDDIEEGAGIAAGVVQAAGRVADALSRLPGERMDTVRAHFSVIDGPDPDWHVRRFHWSEGLSQTYEITLDILTEQTDADTDALLGAQCELMLERGELHHLGYGIIRRMEHVGISGGRLLVRLSVVPALQLLSQTVQTRFFQGHSVPEVLEQVLGPALEAFGRTFSLESCHLALDAYPPLDYCVQYRESDLDFCTRLMEEAGIAYYFTPDADEHVERLVLIDNDSDYGDVELLIDEDVPIIGDRPEEADRESLRFFDWIARRQPNRVRAVGWNWKVPANDDAEASYEDPHHPRVRELYLHDDRRQIVDDPVGDADAASFVGTEHEQRGPLADRRTELLLRRTKVGRGRSNVTGFRPGLKFTVAEHGRDDVEQQRFLLTRVIHSGDAPDQELGGGGGGPAYENAFECIPEAHVFRPAIVTPKPRTWGPQTATVVGPAEGQDETAKQVDPAVARVHTDRHGRIKVRFHWDRHTPHDDTSSCWVRVAQSWAGPQYGVMFIPRVGMEVVVDFLDGNPDRPLVVGCVYNGANPPPYELPAAKTKSTIKTTSSEGGDGFNELRFEDAAGAEEIFLHAQKDFNEKVLNNHSTTVMADQSNTVKGSQSESVGGSQSMTVTGKRNKHVISEETNKVDKKRDTKLGDEDHLETTGLTKQKLVGGLEQTITQFAKLTVSDLYQIGVTGRQKITVDGSSSLSVTNAHAGVAGSRYAIGQGDNGTGASLVLADKAATMNAIDSVTVGVGEGPATMSMGNDGKISITAATSIQLKVGGSVVTIDADGVTAGAATISLTGGEASGLTLDAAAAVLGGPEVKTAGTNANLVTAALVKIN